MFKRNVKISKSHSFFLFGARATGKSTLIKQAFSEDEALWVDLLNPEVEDLLYKSPNELAAMIEAHPKKKWIVIDEIQKNPKLLDVVHSLSKNKELKFVLTGSSARKLKRGGANLLAGRAFKYTCHPLTHVELSEQFKIEEVLTFGSLPEIFSLSNPEDKSDYLRAYVDTYFREEIVAEQIVRKLKPFKNFLQVAAQMNGKILNISKIAQDVGVDHTTIQTYFEILEDTLVGYLLEPFHDSIRRRQRQASKFYYFDLGVTRALKKNLDVPLKPETYDYGEVFEHFCLLEIKRLIDYKKPDWTLSYLRTKDDAEIDLIIERPGLKRVAIEFKSTTKLKSLNEAKSRAFISLVNDLKKSEGFIFSQDPIERKFEGIWCLPWQKGINEIGL